MTEFSNYFRVHVKKETTWFVVGCFRNEDHVAFERTLDGQSDILEFFVPTGQVDFFLDMINYMKKHDYVYSVEQLPNRLASL